MKKQLETVITSIVEENAEEAKKAFHEYLRAKTQSILIGESEEECDDEDKDGDKDEDEDKEDKTPPFAKKDKKEKKDEESDDSDDEDK
jgi:hypothetical protein